MPPVERATWKGRLYLAIFGYGVALVLFLFGRAAHSAEAQRYLYDDALICAAGFTGALLSSFWTRRD